MDRGLIEEKLEALRRCIDRIESKRPPTAAALATDSDLQDIIALNHLEDFKRFAGAVSKAL